MAWSDEFNGAAGAAADPTKWRYADRGDGGGNHELEYYVPGAHNGVQDGRGHLVISARPDNSGRYHCWYGNCRYTSARLETAETFSTRYGRFEARIKTPGGFGMFPAWWMLGKCRQSWPACGEIDIAQTVGALLPGTNLPALIGPGYAAAEAVSSPYTLPDRKRLADDFHTYSIEWSPGRVQWSLDGATYMTATVADVGGKPYPFDKYPFYMILNLAVGSISGIPDFTTTQQMVIDYVRVYRKSP